MIRVTSVVRKARSRQEADQIAVEQPDSTADQHHRRNHQSNRPTRQIEQRERHEISEREVRSNAEIDAADDDHDHHRHANQAELTEFASRDCEVRTGEEVRNERAEIVTTQEEDQERYRVINPLLGQKLRR